MLPRKINNSHYENRLKNEGNISSSINKIYNNKNLDFLLKKRFSYISKYLDPNDKILELGCGAGHSKRYIDHKNLKISDVTDYEFLDFKNIDCLDTPFQDESFDCIFSLGLIHHLPNPIRLFNEVGRILKKNGKYIILDTNCSFFLKLIIMITKSEKYDLDVNIYDDKINLTNPKDPFDSNNPIPTLIFNDFGKFNNNLKYNFEINDFKYQEFLTFVNSGGVIIDAPYIPLNKFFLNCIDKFDNTLSIFNKIFPLNFYACLTKK
jgi:SAM-dependent methyltransferase